MYCPSQSVFLLSKSKGSSNQISTFILLLKDFSLSVYLYILVSQLVSPGLFFRTISVFIYCMCVSVSGLQHISLAPCQYIS